MFTEIVAIYMDSLLTYKYNVHFIAISFFLGVCVGGALRYVILREGGAEQCGSLWQGEGVKNCKR